MVYVLLKSEQILCQVKICAKIATHIGKNHQPVVKRQASSVKRQASSVKRQRLSAHDTTCQPLNALIFLFLPKPAFMWAFFVSKLCPKGGAK
ncbi:hypothetical protein SQ02_00860 [Moraxella catarrhalis]|nr:hypothetical protein SQ02_00860 [Moraxella catarrhalis]